jgi:hypothetical protein
VDTDYLHLDIDEAGIADDLLKITNTLELKLVPENEKLLLGFIHTGSEYFSCQVLTPWLNKVIGSNLLNHAATPENTGNQLFGLPAKSRMGYEFQQYVKITMNYCIVKRWLLFNRLKTVLEQKFAVRVEAISDTCHAGLFEVKNDLIQTRGIQLTQRKRIAYLMAGQRESVSYLITKNKSRAYPKYLSHGTSYMYHSDYPYEEHLSLEEKNQVGTNLSRIHANTPLEKDKCLAFYYNIKMQKSLLHRYNLGFLPLYPYLNYQGPYLRGVLT